MARYKSQSGCKEARQYRFGTEDQGGNFLATGELFPNAGLWLVGGVVAAVIYAANQPKRRRY